MAGVASFLNIVEGQQEQTMRRFIIASVGICVACHVVTAMSSAQQPPPDESIALFEEVLDKVRQNHHGKEYSRRELVEAAIEGMLLQVDPDGMYFNEDALTLFNQTVTIRRGQLGFGVHFERQLTIESLSTSPNSSGLEAGLLPGDRIVEIDGKPVGAMSGVELMHALIGAPKTQVALKVIPSSEPRAATLVRR